MPSPRKLLLYSFYILIAYTIATSVFYAIIRPLFWDIVYPVYRVLMDPIHRFILGTYNHPGYDAWGRDPSRHIPHTYGRQTQDHFARQYHDEYVTWPADCPSGPSCNPVTCTENRCAELVTHCYNGLSRCPQGLHNVWRDGCEMMRDACEKREVQGAKDD
ncbi:hypothetical protein ACHAQH_006282 [Verticillium albo-atrum]